MKDRISAEEREKLYEEIWAEAMSKVAPRYGVSDVWLRKKCMLWDIPVPSREYRGRVAHGQKPWRTPLPELSREAKRYVYGYAVTYIDVKSLPEAALYCEEPLYVYSEMTKKNVEHARRILEVQPFLKNLNDEQRGKLKELEKDKKCKSTIPYKRLFCTIQAIRRCLNDLEGGGYTGISDARLWVAESRWDVKYLITTENENCKTGFTFTEDKWRSERKLREFTVYDTDEMTIEDQAGEIVYKLFDESGKIILLEELEQRRKIKREEEAAYQRKLAPHIKEENDKVAHAYEDAAAYEKAIAIRGFADAYYQKNHTAFSEKPELRAYYEWLLKRADWVDPLIENDYAALLREKT